MDANHRHFESELQAQAESLERTTPVIRADTHTIPATAL